MLELMKQQFYRLENLRDLGLDVLIKSVNKDIKTNFLLCNITEAVKTIKQLMKQSIENKTDYRGSLVISFNQKHYNTCHFSITKEGLVSAFILDAVGEYGTSSLIGEMTESLGENLSDVYLVGDEHSNENIQKGLGCKLFAIEHAIECSRIPIFELLSKFKADNLGHSIGDFYYQIPWAILPPEFLQYTQSQSLWESFKTKNSHRQDYLNYPNYDLIHVNRMEYLKKSQCLTIAKGGDDKTPGFNGNPIPCLFQTYVEKVMAFVNELSINEQQNIIDYYCDDGETLNPIVEEVFDDSHDETLDNTEDFTDKKYTHSIDLINSFLANEYKLNPNNELITKMQHIIHNKEITPPKKYEHLQDIANLALLNRGISSAFFYVKNENSANMIKLCTFLKQFDASDIASFNEALETLCLPDSDTDRLSRIKN